MPTRIINGKKVEVTDDSYVTAPIAAIKEQKPISKVPVPGEENVERAKNWVDNGSKL